jgi:hypothetical protein
MEDSHELSPSGSPSNPSRHRVLHRRVTTQTRVHSRSCSLWRRILQENEFDSEEVEPTPPPQSPFTLSSLHASAAGALSPREKLKILAAFHGKGEKDLDLTEPQIHSPTGATISKRRGLTTKKHKDILRRFRAAIDSVMFVSKTRVRFFNACNISLKRRE